MGQSFPPDTPPRAPSRVARWATGVAAALLSAVASFGTASPARRMAGKVRIGVAALVVSAAAFVGVAQKESFRGVAYLDSAHVPTLGYGTTAGVRMGDTITPERALVRLQGDVDEHARALQRCITVPLYQHEFDAYVSLAYNIGASTFCRRAPAGQAPTLLDLINAQRYAEACDRILAYDKYRNPRTGQLETLRGLTNRRQAEHRTCRGEG